jgi:hypothetical protein
MNTALKSSSLHRWQGFALQQNAALGRRIGKGFIGRSKTIHQQHHHHHHHHHHHYDLRARFLSSQSSSSSDVVFKRWKDPMVEATGDYRKERYLEEHIGGPLYENQSTLPKLPVPTVEDTIKRFLPTALPLATTKEEEIALRAACDDFPEAAKGLQERLLQRKDGTMNDTSWLQVWWNQVKFVSKHLQRAY